MLLLHLHFSTVCWFVQLLRRHCSAIESSLNGDEFMALIYCAFTYWHYCMAFFTAILRIFRDQTFRLFSFYVAQV